MRKQPGPGPWDNEPNRTEFEHAGFPCLTRRNGLGAWCGYVGVPPGHPWHGKDWQGIEADVHGGITYAKGCDGDPVGGICHIPKPGEADDVWWLGFDCAHAGDFVPMLNFDSGGDVYRDLEYTRGQCMKLAEQARDAR